MSIVKSIRVGGDGLLVAEVEEGYEILGEYLMSGDLESWYPEVRAFVDRGLAGKSESGDYISANAFHVEVSGEKTVIVDWMDDRLELTTREMSEALDAYLQQERALRSEDR